MVRIGTRPARFEPFAVQNKALGELLAERNDAFLARYLDDDLVADDYAAELRRQVAAAQIHPIYFGSAMTGAGVAELIEGIRSWLPRAIGSPSDALQARVFKVERGAAVRRQPPQPKGIPPPPQPDLTVSCSGPGWCGSC